MPPCAQLCSVALSIQKSICHSSLEEILSHKHTILAFWFNFLIQSIFGFRPSLSCFIHPRVIWIPPNLWWLPVGRFTLLFPLVLPRFSSFSPFYSFSSYETRQVTAAAVPFTSLTSASLHPPFLMSRATVRRPRDFLWRRSWTARKSPSLPPRLASSSLSSSPCLKQWWRSVSLPAQPLSDTANVFTVFIKYCKSTKSREKIIALLKGKVWIKLL